MGKYAKEIIVWHERAGLYIIKKVDGHFGLTNKANATKFSSIRAVKAAIKYCRKHICLGMYRHQDLRKAGKEDSNGNGI